MAASSGDVDLGTLEIKQEGYIEFEVEKNMILENKLRLDLDYLGPDTSPADFGSHDQRILALGFISIEVINLAAPESGQTRVSK